MTIVFIVPLDALPLARVLEVLNVACGKVAVWQNLGRSLALLTQAEKALNLI